MQKQTIVILASLILSCSSYPIGLFDFNKRNASRCVLRRSNNDPLVYDFNSTISELTAAVFKGESKDKLPEKVTICSTIYDDIDDCDGSGDGPTTGHYHFAYRTYPTWAFAHNGSANLSLQVRSDGYHDYESLQLMLHMGSFDKLFYELGMQQF